MCKSPCNELTCVLNSGNKRQIMCVFNEDVDTEHRTISLHVQFNNHNMLKSCITFTHITYVQTQKAAEK
ncbi:hypothetical protein FKM82_016953 [Ascaphus truei]